MFNNQSRMLVLAKTVVVVIFTSALCVQDARADFMSDYFKGDSIVKLTTPQRFNVNLPYAKNGGMINTFEPDNTEEWKFQVIRPSADGIKFKRVGTNHVITAQKFPSFNLSPLESFKDVGGEDKFQTWIAIPTKPGFFALCLKAQRDQCMNVPNSKNRTKLTTYKFNPNDPNQMFSVGVIKTATRSGGSTLGIPVNFNSSAYRENNPFWKEYAPPSVGGWLDKSGNCTWYANGRLRELGYSSNALKVLNRNAYEWSGLARNVNIPMGSTPMVGAIAQWNSNHVAVVEQINNDGTIVISESSYPYKGSPEFLYKQRTIKASEPSIYIYVPR